MIKQPPHIKPPTNKKNCNRGNTLERSVEKTTGVGGVSNQFYLRRETAPLILMQLQITNIYSVCIWVLYLVY